jgi:threonine dehydratase
MVHPYNQPRVIAAQATVALELLDEVPDLDFVICPVGGGGLLAGTAIIAKDLRPGIKVHAGEPEGAADALQSLRAGVRTPVSNPSSMADGLLAFVGDLTFPVMQDRVDGITAVSEGEISAAMRQLLETLKIVIEPSGAVSYAAAASGRIDIRGRKVGIILSGGNVDIDRNPWAAPAG